MVLQAGRPQLPADKDPRYVALAVVSAGNSIDPLRFEEFAVAPGKVTGKFTDAEPVKGRPAKWNLESPAVALRWEYAPGAWAEVMVSNLDGDARAIARQVAEDVRFGANSTVALPIHPTALPASLKPTVVSVSQVIGTPTTWMAQIAYGNTRLKPNTGDWPLTIMAVASNRRTGDGAVLANPTTTLDGHPARRSTSRWWQRAAGLRRRRRLPGVAHSRLGHSRAAQEWAGWALPPP
jgi:hypothetical protein